MTVWLGRSARRSEDLVSSGIRLGLAAAGADDDVGKTLAKTLRRSGGSTCASVALVEEEAVPLEGRNTGARA